MNLPDNYSRCWNSDCELRLTCLRYISPSRSGYESVKMFKGGKRCVGYISLNTKFSGREGDD